MNSWSLLLIIKLLIQLTFCIFSLQLSDTLLQERELQRGSINLYFFPSLHAQISQHLYPLPHRPFTHCPANRHLVHKNSSLKSHPDFLLIQTLFCVPILLCLLSCFKLLTMNPAFCFPFGKAVYDKTRRDMSMFICYWKRASKDWKSKKEGMN